MSKNTHSPREDGILVVIAVLLIILTAVTRLPGAGRETLNCLFDLSTSPSILFTRPTGRVMPESRT